MKTFAAAATLWVVGATLACATSITPLVDRGVTFAEKKVQVIVVSNAYTSAREIVIEAFEPDLVTPAQGVALRATRISLASNGRRRLRVLFDVPGAEREIAICVRTEQTDEEMVIPRVCGRYYARRVGAGRR
ncbi:MAG: hypothetical protein AAFR16_01415 [Pseudomonadota bacterium]